MSLRDGTKKMSKSEESDYSRINLKDSPDEITKKIKKAKSDSEEIPDNLKSLENKPESLNLINIFAEISKNSLENVLNEMSGKEYSFLKTKLTDLIISEIGRYLSESVIKSTPVADMETILQFPKIQFEFVDLLSITSKHSKEIGMLR